MLGGFPGIKAIHKLAKSWKVPHTFHIHKFGWLVFLFGSKKERQDVIDGGPYMIFNRPIVMKPMTPLFCFGSASFSIIPVWVNLPGAPCDIWNAKVLTKISSKIVIPFYTDAMTASKERHLFCKSPH